MNKKIKKTEERLDELEFATAKNHNDIIEQEHRLINIVINIYKGFKSEKTGDLKAALKSLFYRCIPGRLALIISTGSAIGLMTVLLMQKNNELLADQNYYFQKQIYQQTRTDYARTRSEVKQRLYEATSASEQEIQLWLSLDEVEREKNTKPKREPLYNKFTRQEALEQFIDLSLNPPETPIPPKKESEFQLAKNFLCKYFALWCSEIQEVPLTPNECQVIEIDFSEALLSGTKWKNISLPKCTRFDFSSAEMEDATFSNSNIINSIFYNTNLRQARFIKTNLTDSEFTNANLHNSEFKETNLEKASFKSSDLSNAHFVKVNIDNTDFREANFRGVHIPTLNFSKANIQRARLGQANLTPKALRSLNLFRADLSGSDLINWNLEQVNFTLTNLNKAKLSGAKFKGTTFGMARLIESEIKDSDLSGITFENAILDKANLNNSKLMGANLFMASMIDAGLEKADFSDAQLGKAVFRDAKLADAIFINAYLFETDFSGADLSRADFRGASLYNNFFRNADLTHANFIGSKGFNCKKIMYAKNWRKAKTEIKCDPKMLIKSLKPSIKSQPSINKP